MKRFNASKHDLSEGQAGSRCSATTEPDPVVISTASLFSSRPVRVVRPVGMSGHPPLHEILGQSESSKESWYISRRSSKRIPIMPGEQSDFGRLIMLLLNIII